MERDLELLTWSIVAIFKKSISLEKQAFKVPKRV
jgi:hypothetical protein